MKRQTQPQILYCLKLIWKAHTDAFAHTSKDFTIVAVSSAMQNLFCLTEVFNIDLN